MFSCFFYTCQYETDRKEEHEYHLNNHRNVPLKRYVCKLKGCLYSEDNKLYLMKHQDEDHVEYYNIIERATLSKKKEEKKQNIAKFPTWFLSP